MSVTVRRWLGLEHGITLVGRTDAHLPSPNLLVMGAARLWNSKVAGSGALLMWQPDPDDAPLAGFVTDRAEIAAMLRKLFADTPFEEAPLLPGGLKVSHDPALNVVNAELSVIDISLAWTLAGLGALDTSMRDPTEPTPFAIQSFGAAPEDVGFTQDDEPVPLIISSAGLAGGPAARWSPWGLWAR